MNEFSVAVPEQIDVLVAGAGLVGLAAAVALAQSGLTVAVSDRSPVAMPEASAGSDDWDSRIYAISPGSAAFLRSIGAWQHLSCDRVQAIETMRVEGDAGAALGFSAYELEQRALAWIVEERTLRAGLVSLVRTAGVRVLTPRSFSSMNGSGERVLLRFTDDSAVAARLVVGADGLYSWIRQASGITDTPKPYRQTAVVANFKCERAHHGRAWQWFRTDGSILAWLPLPGRRMSMVWSAPDALAQELLLLDPLTLSARIATAGRHVLGALQCITPAAGFSLSSLKLAKTDGPRLVLIGDAAHGVHPLAGQGVNLGFGDAEALSTVLRARGPIDDVGTPSLLAHYSRRRAEPVQAMHFVTDGLTRLFSSTTGWARITRNLGLTAIDRLPLAKRFLAQAALR